VTRSLAPLPLWTLLLVACSPSPSGREDAANTPDVGADAVVLEADAGAGEGDAPSVLDAPSACTAPTAPYGAAVGDTFAGFNLPRCGGEPYVFYEGGYCEAEHTATVVIFSALWCTVCQSESSRVDEEITDPYGARGVRVVQVLVDGTTPGRAVDATGCQDWDDTFELDAEVLYDTDDLTFVHYPEATFPVTLVVDADGVIRFRDVHGGAGLSGLAAALDSVLAE